MCILPSAVAVHEPEVSKQHTLTVCIYKKEYGKKL